MKKSVKKSLMECLSRLVAARMGDRARRRTIQDLTPAASHPKFPASDAALAGRAAQCTVAMAVQWRRRGYGTACQRMQHPVDRFTWMRCKGTGRIIHGGERLKNLPTQSQLGRRCKRQTALILVQADKPAALIGVVHRVHARTVEGRAAYGGQGLLYQFAAGA